jgi:hypothetical protein
VAVYRHGARQAETFDSIGGGPFDRSCQSDAQLTGSGPNMYEYDELDADSPQGLLRLVNEAAVEGWRLVSAVAHANGRLVAFLERPAS